MAAARTAAQDSGSLLFNQSVFALDRWLRKRQGIYDYSSDSRCIFRLQKAYAEHDFCLAGGTRVRADEPMLKLHIWNEHMPAMGPEGPTLAWGHEVRGKADFSLRELARYLSRESQFADVRVIGADMHLGTPLENRRLVALAAQYGFETAENVCARSGVLHRLGQNILMLLLVLATNRPAARATVLRRADAPLYLPRTVLERRYGRNNKGLERN